jgi:hypothetical protein
MIKEKKVPVQIAVNFIKNSLMNIEKNEQFELKLLSILEKLITTSSFSSNKNVFKINTEKGIKTFSTFNDFEGLKKESTKKVSVFNDFD